MPTPDASEAKELFRKSQVIPTHSSGVHSVQGQHVPGLPGPFFVAVMHRAQPSQINPAANEITGIFANEEPRSFIYTPKEARELAKQLLEEADAVEKKNRDYKEG